MPEENTVLVRELWEKAVLESHESIENSLRVLRKLGAISIREQRELKGLIDDKISYQRSGGEWHK